MIKKTIENIKIIAIYKRLIDLKNIASIKKIKSICVKIYKSIGFQVKKITKNKLYKNN